MLFFFLVKDIIGDFSDYFLLGIPLEFGLGATPINCVTDERLCFSFEAVQDDIHEEEEKFALLLGSADSALHLCRDRAHVAIPVDDTDSKRTSFHNLIVSDTIILH